MIGSAAFAGELASMALKSALPSHRWNVAGWRSLWLGALAVGMLAVGMLAAAAPAPAEDAQDAAASAAEIDQARRVVAEVVQQPDVQHDRPGPLPPEEPERPAGKMDLGWLPYVILGVICLGLLAVLLRYLTRLPGRGNAGAKVAPATASSSVLPAAAAPERDHTFDEIDALAQSGAFTEAVHRLLLLVQERLRSRIEHGIQASLTSREILRRAKLAGEGATAFATLVAAVEVSLFGMRSANAATYALCRENSRRVLAAAAE
jgi:hypothetical protein